MANEVKTPIPARLYNAAVGGHVAGADDIIDDKTGMVVSELVGNKLATSEENPFNGMGVVILPMNIQEVEEDDTTVQKNILTQAMMNQANTKYVIKYDFTLGEDITVPASCVLEFDGGSISGAYTITGVLTKIIAKNITIFNNGVLISGTWNCPIINADWFSDIENIDRVYQLVNLSSNDIYNTIIIPKNKTCNITSVNSDGGLSLKSNTKLILDGIISLVANNVTTSRVIRLYKVSNITIEGTGSIIGDKDSHTGLDGEYQHGIWIEECQDVTIKGITVKKCMGDCISIGGNSNHSTDVLVENCFVTEGRRCCFSIANVVGCRIIGCKITNAGGEWPEGYTDPVNLPIDVELNAQEIRTIQNVLIENCIIESDRGIGCNSTEADKGPENVIIRNNVIKTVSRGINSQNTKNVLIENNIIEVSNGHSIACGNTKINYKGNVSIINNIITCNNIITSGSDIIVTGNLINSRDVYFENAQVIFKNNKCQLVGSFYIACNNSVVSDNIITCAAFFINTYTVISNNTINCTAITRIGSFSRFINNTVTINIPSAGYQPIILEDDATVDCNIINLTGDYSAEEFIYGRRRSLIRNNKFTAITNPTYGILASFGFLPTIIVLNNNFPSGLAYNNNDTFKCIEVNMPKSGTFANKPSASDIYVGYKYFCTDKQTTEGATDGIEIIHKGNNVWVDALGRVVS